MKSYPTIDAARADAGDGQIIVEIEPGVPGIERYIIARCDERTLRVALAGKPMPEIRRVIGVVADLARERREAREANLRARVPGLDRLRAAREDAARYRRECEQMMEDESNDGARPPRQPAADPQELARQYPIAALYLRAESYGLASHYAKAGAGRRAQKRIEAGEDAETVIAEMEREWSDHANQHAD